MPRGHSPNRPSPGSVSVRLVALSALPGSFLFECGAAEPNIRILSGHTFSVALFGGLSAVRWPAIIIARAGIRCPATSYCPVRSEETMMSLRFCDVMCSREPHSSDRKIAMAESDSVFCDVCGALGCVRGKITINYR